MATQIRGCCRWPRKRRMFDIERFVRGVICEQLKSRTIIAFHGSSVPIEKFSTEPGAMNAIWFSEDREKILRGESGAAATDYLMTVELSVTRTAGWDEYETLMLDQIEQDGFDSILLDDDWVMFDASRVKVTRIEKI